MSRIGDFLKHAFVPHHGNGHRPHILRSGVVGGILAMVLVVQVAALFDTLALRSKDGFLAAILSSVIVDLTNQARAADHVGTLSVNPLLVKAAQEKADDMAKHGYFAHIAPDGTTPWHWFADAGYSYLYAGENLAVDFTDSSDVVNAWMASPTHRENIDKPVYTEIGVASASGIYQGKSAIFVVQMFGSPAPVTAASKPLPIADSSAVLPAQSRGVAGKVLAAEAQKPVMKSVAVPTRVPAVLVAVAPSGTYSELQKIFVRPGAISAVAIEIAFGLFALALLAAIFVRRHLIHKETLRNGALALCVLSLAIFLHGNFFSQSVGLPESNVGAAISLAAE